MINKNVAEYTNFQGKTNKKIVQAPGGSSSVSLAWSNEPTDYGPSRHFKKKTQYSHGQPATQKESKFGFNPNNEMKVMEEAYMYKPKSRNYEHGENSIPLMGHNMIGGQYGYNNFKKPSNSAKNIPSEKDTPSLLNRKPQQIDIAVYEQKMLKNNRPPSVAKRIPNENKACIKVNPPSRQNLILGDVNYNYWKDSSNTKTSSEKKINYQQSSHVQNVEEKTSVQVSNPPGGKGTFMFG